MIMIHRTLGLLFGVVLSCSSMLLAQPDRRGDVNQDGLVDVADVMGILDSLYGPEPISCLAAADANIDGRLDIADAIRVSQQIFLDGEELAPFSQDDPNPCSALQTEGFPGEAEGGGGGASLLWQDNFDRLPPSGPGKYLYAAPAGSIEVQTMAARKGLMMRCGVSQPRDANGRIRTEVSLWEPGRTSKIFKKDPIGSERWYAFAIYIPTSWWYDVNKVHLAQWHGTEDPGETGIGRNPNLTIIALGSELRIRQLWSTRRIQTANENRADIWRGKLERGKWMSFVFHMKWSYRSDGFLEVWKDGKKIIDQDNHPNCYNDAEGPYFNLGMYWPSAIKKYAYPRTAAHTAYYDFLRIGDGRNVLQDMTP